MNSIASMADDQHAGAFGEIAYTAHIIRFSWFTHKRLLFSILLVALGSTLPILMSLTQTKHILKIQPARIYRPIKTGSKVADKTSRLPLLRRGSSEVVVNSVVEAMPGGKLDRYAFRQIKLKAVGDHGSVHFQPVQTHSQPDPFASILTDQHESRPAVALAYADLQPVHSRMPVIVPVNVSHATEQPAHDRHIERLVAFLNRGKNLDEILSAADVADSDRQALEQVLQAVPPAPLSRLELLIKRRADADDGKLLMARLVQKGRDEIYARDDDGHFHSITNKKIFRRLVGLASLSRTRNAEVLHEETQTEETEVPKEIADQVLKLADESGFELAGKPVDLMVRTDSKGHSDLVSITLHDADGLRRIYRYNLSSDGKPEFFDEKGNSVSQLLLKQPVPNGRLGDGFGWRIHPILKRRMHHNGVDYAAPYGSPIQAAGDGVVVKISSEGGYGKYVRIKHDFGYYTTYAHISGVPKSLKIGDRVHQGQVIAYVGSTGLSTGPHLYYELREDGRYLDPRSTRLQAGTKLAGALKDDFSNLVSHIKEIERLTTLRQ